VATATVIATLAAAGAGCGEKDEPPATATTAPPETSTTSATGETAAAQPESERPSAREREVREVERTVERYVAALDSRDGAAVCALLAPGALEDVRFPRERGGCAASFDASIGYRDPRGLPVFEGATVTGFVSTDLRGDEARSTATTITDFADRDEPSVEDDIVYLVRRGDEWFVAKASSVLYRAIGVADVPPSVLTPPSG
jgi:hypothetical protein